MTGGQDHSGDAVRQRLAEIQQRADATPEGPWRRTELVSEGKPVYLLHAADNRQLIETFYTGEAIVSFVEASRSDVPRLVAALTGTPERPGVLDLHFSVKRRASVVSPDPSGYLDVCSHCSAIGDASLAIAWPCPTYRAVAAALEEQP